MKHREAHTNWCVLVRVNHRNRGVYYGIVTAPATLDRIGLPSGEGEAIAAALRKYGNNRNVYDTVPVAIGYGSDPLRSIDPVTNPAYVKAQRDWLPAETGWRDIEPYFWDLS